MSVPVIIVGAGGHAKVLSDALDRSGVTVLGITVKNGDKSVEGAPPWLAARILGDDSVVEDYAPDTVDLVNGVGSVGRPDARRAVFDRFRHRGYRFRCVVHPHSVVAADVSMEQGTQIMAGVVVQPGCALGENLILNTRCSVDHDCTIGAHVHIAPGATLSGSVTVGAESHIGTGASVIQGIRIGARVVIAAGAAVVGDVPDGVTVAGCPAHEVRK